MFKDRVAALSQTVENHIDRRENHYKVDGQVDDVLREYSKTRYDVRFLFLLVSIMLGVLSFSLTNLHEISIFFFLTSSVIAGIPFQSYVQVSNYVRFGICCCAVVVALFYSGGLMDAGIILIITEFCILALFIILNEVFEYFLDLYAAYHITQKRYYGSLLHKASETYGEKDAK